MKHIQTLFLLLLFPFFSACDGNTAARKAARGENYVPAPNRIFFKNTRARHYTAEDLPANFTVYRHEDILASDAALIPTIVDRWIEDRAQLLLETRLQQSDSPQFRPFRMEVSPDDEWQVIPLTTPPSVDEIKVLQDHIYQGHQLRIVSGLDTLNAFPQSALPAAREVFNDFLRLIDQE
ncbi:hypothetical protein [Neolewinella agarilytica]|uniref:hypothetical protein n=1 Tax=Neolewinella agarilytica TaxID=478744 RepID=UPI0023573D6F|nr:hypothetical protein [Neolewinella agarilytica]